MTVGDIDTHSAMLPILPNLRELYYADSVSDLKTKADLKIDNMADRKVESYEKMIKTSLNQANKSMASGDQEMAYIFFYRAASIITIGSKSKQVDSKYFQCLYSSDLKRCLTTIEKLEGELEVRYNRRSHFLKSGRPTVADPPATEKPSQTTPVNNASQDVKPERFKTITSKELYEMFKSPNKNDTIVILQTRSQADYKTKRMDKLPSNVELVQIDPDLIRKYPSKSNLTAQLDVKSRASLASLKGAKHVILMDESSEELTKDSPLEQLYNIFFKLVQDSERCKAEPVILKGGFLDWSFTYTTYTTQIPLDAESSSSLPIQQASSKAPSTQAKSETSSTPSTPLINGNSSISHPPLGNFNVVNEKTQVPDSNVVYNWKSAPGGAKQVAKEADQVLTNKSVAKPVPSVPDRSTKPNLVSPTDAPINDTNGDVVRSSVTDAQYKAPPNAAASDDEDGIEELSNETNRITLNDQASKRVLPRGSLDSSTFSRGKPNHEHINHQPRIADRTVSESRSDFGPAAPLQRSFSVPSLNDVNENEPLPGRIIPSVDRSIKPPSTLADRRGSTLEYREVSLLCGLKNLGNTCYMNSILQCLANCRDLISYFLSGKHNDHLLLDGKFGSGGTLARNLGMLFRHMASTRSFSFVSPNEFRKIVGGQMPSFTLGDQHDSHEFFTMLIDKLHADLNQAARDPNYIKLLNNKRNASAKANNNSLEKIQTHIALKKFYEEHTSLNRSIFTELFEGILLSTLECSVCSTKSDTFEIFTCLSLPIASNNGGGRTTLADCWQAFVADESLTGDAAWDCDVCKTKRDAVKKIKICRLPKVLVIHLKRFSYHGLWREKLNTYVDFPQRIQDLTNYLFVGTQSHPYELTGIVNHMGTIDGGHYTAHCKNPLDGKWYKFNDQEVVQLSPSDVRTPQAAYVLFYQASH